MNLDLKSLQKYSVNTAFMKGYVLYLTLLLYINGLPDCIICNIAISANDITRYLQIDQASNLLQQLKFVCELKSDLQGTVNCGRKWPLGFNPERTQPFSFDQSRSLGAIDVKMDGSVIKKASLKILKFSCFSKLDCGS